MRLAIWFLALLLATGFAASPASAQDRYMAGLGNNPGSPVGTPLAPPAGVRLVSVKGFDNRKDCKETELGVGDEELCLTFCTEEDRSYIVHIPAGTMFKHLAGEIFDRMQREKGFQNVIVVDDLNFFIADSLCAHLMLPPSEREEAKRKLRAQRAAKGEPSPANPGLPSGGRFLLRAMCLNQEMDVPGEGAEYALGTVTSHPKLRLVLGAVKGRKIEDDRARRLLQDAIWDVTEGYGLEQETLARLRALPAGRQRRAAIRGSQTGHLAPATFPVLPRPSTASHMAGMNRQFPQSSLGAWLAAALALAPLGILFWAVSATSGNGSA